MALILRNGGSQSPDRWLREPRNNHLTAKSTLYLRATLSKDLILPSVTSIDETPTPSPTSFFTEVLPCVFCAFCLRWFRYIRIAAFKTLASNLAVLITRAIVFCVTSSYISTSDLHFHVRMLR